MTRNRVTGFVLVQDRTDLRVIDTDGGASNGNQAFSFRSALGFTWAGAEIRTSQANGATVASGDVEGDRVVNFQITC